MATTERMKERIEAFAREIAEEFGEIDESTCSVDWMLLRPNR